MGFDHHFHALIRVLFLEARMIGGSKRSFNLTKGFDLRNESISQGPIKDARRTLPKTHMDPGGVVFVSLVFLYQLSVFSDGRCIFYARLTVTQAAWKAKAAIDPTSRCRRVRSARWE